MDAIDVLSECRRLGVRIALDGEDIVAQSRSALPEHVRQELRDNKDQVVLCLRACLPATCNNPLTAHAAHQYSHECQTSSCGCFQNFGEPRWCEGAPCRWIWP